MKRTRMHYRIFALAALALVLLNQTVLARCRLPDDATFGLKKKAAPAKEVFHVYGGNCSRSTQLLATCDNLWDANRAAVEARKKFRRVAVTSGADQHYILGSVPSEYRVYRNPCKSWSVDAKTDNLAKATELEKAIETSGDRAEVVHHFIAKK